MNAALREADERFEIVSAAEAWHGAGAIDDAALAALRARFADDRRRTKPAFRALFFLFTILTGLATWGFLGAFLDVRLFGGSGALQHVGLLGFLATAAAWGANHALETVKLRRFGIEEALVCLAIGFESGALGLGLDRLDVPERGIGFALGWNLAALALVAAGRWGITGTGALSGLGLFGALALLPAPVSRLAWIAAALPLAAAARWISRLDRAAVAHRKRADELYVVALLALYLAVHVSAASALLFDPLDRFNAGTSGRGLSGAAATLGWVAMTALPLLLLVAGLRRRDRLDLALGALGLAATATSAADALDLGPPWLLLTAAGALLLGLALALRARFRRSPERLVGGFTDEPLFEPTESRGFLEIAATLAAFAPAPRPMPSGEPATFRGDGGDFGGGGATSKF